MNLPSLSSITTISPLENIADSLSAINTNYSTLQAWVTSVENQYNGDWQNVISYYSKYGQSLLDTLSLVQSASGEWDAFQTLVESNSASWLQPFTIFYPTIIQSPFTQSDIDGINAWIRKYFPIKNADGTLNYVENQQFVVNCYTYALSSQINVNDTAYSYSECSTTSGTIYAHCVSVVTGGTVVCTNATYNCNMTINCNPSLHVDCWYNSPYLLDIPPYGEPIPDSEVFNATDQYARGQIMANLTMNFNDRRETKVAAFRFLVSDCDWVYGGVL